MWFQENVAASFNKLNDRVGQLLLQPDVPFIAFKKLRYIIVYITWIEVFLLLMIM